jgi:hypothetical protein
LLICGPVILGLLTAIVGRSSHSRFTVRAMSHIWKVKLSVLILLEIFTTDTLSDH